MFARATLVFLCLASSMGCSAIVRDMLKDKDGGSADADQDGDGVDAADAPDGIICNPPYVICDGKCTNPMLDRENCGECGVNCEVPAYCNQGSCDCPTDLPGWMACDGVCVFVFTDTENCGDCGVECPRGQICDGTGECASNCSAGFELCVSGSTQYCADLRRDISNCGGCGVLCPIVPHASPKCEDGECAVSCDEGWIDGNGDQGDGCECLDMGDEVCDGMDNDCNGFIDEGFECSIGARESCMPADSTCTGTRVCTDTCTWSACENPDWQCTPGSLNRSCILHGSCSGSQSCRSDCTWSECANTAWNCFTPGATESCIMPSESMCPGTRTCLNCIWTGCREACEGANPDCCPLTGCTNLTNDRLHCGSCTIACESNEVCVSSSCTPTDTSTDVIIDTIDVFDEPDVPDLTADSEVDSGDSTTETSDIVSEY